MEFKGLVGFLRRMSSYVFGIDIKRVHSPLNGWLDIWLVNGRLVLNSENGNLSFAGLHKIFQRSFRIIDLKARDPKRVLLLGLAGGSVPKIIYEELQMNPLIDAIEYDPIMIGLAEKYFDIKRHQNLNIIEADAYEFVQTAKEGYDLIVVDLFTDVKVPLQFFDEVFNGHLFRLLNKKGSIIFNSIIANASFEEQYSRLENFYTSQPGLSLKSYPMLSNNRVLWVENS